MGSSSHHRPPALRLSNSAQIRCIISQFETKNDAKRATLREIDDFKGAKRVERYGNSVKEIKKMLRQEFDTVDKQCSDNVNSCIVYNHPTYESQEDDPSTSNDYWKSSLGLVIGALEMCLRRIGHMVLRCLPPVNSTNLAAVSVAVSAACPGLITHFILYPCCRLVFGTLYPAYASYKAVRTKNVKEYVKWMMYWIVFALFTCAETFTDVFFSWFPFYYEVKILLVLWLLSPATKGSSILYRKFVHPALCRREQEIDEYISKAKDQGYHTVLNLGTKGVNYATNVIMQTAIKGGGGLVQQLRKSYSLSDLSVSDDHSDGRSQQEIDEADDVVTDPRLIRRSVSTRGRSPRAIGPPRVDMFFPEVDVAHNPRAVGRENINLSHIRSTEDISSAYIPDNISSQEALMRTASVGGTTRTRSKVTRSTFTSIKRPGAAEDSEVTIEELDDDDYPSYSQNPSDNIDSTEPSEMMEKYFMLMMQQQAKESGTASSPEEQYKKYMEMKKLFEPNNLQKSEEITQEPTTAVEPVVNETKTEKANTEEPKTEEAKTEETKSAVDDISNDANIIPKEDVIEPSSNEFKIEEAKGADDGICISGHLVLKDDAVETTTKPTESEPSSVSTEIEIPKISLQTQSGDTIDSDIVTENKNAAVEEVKNTLVEDSSNIAFLGQSNISLESSIGASTSTLSSESDADETDFTTPNSSPVLSAKLNKTAKSKKRHAPPPPVRDSSSTEPDAITEKITSVSPARDNAKEEPLYMPVSSVQIVVESKPEFSNKTGSINDISSKKIEDNHYYDQMKGRQKPKNKSPSRKSSAKNESSLSKLMHLSSKFSFWKSEKSNAKSNANDRDSDSNDNLSYHDGSSLSNFGSATDVKAIVDKNIDIIAELSSRKETEVMIPLNVKATTPDIDDDVFQDATSDSNYENKLENSELKNDIVVKNDTDVNYAYIPLVVNAESKSTDV